MAEYLIAVNDKWVPDLTAEEVTRWPQEVHRFPPRRGHDGRPVGPGEG